MSTKKKHIALLLLGAFMFPLVFQPVHILWHHHYEDVLSHISNISASKAVRFYKTPVFSVANDHCLVCEYKFTINQIPEYSVYVALIPIKVCIQKIEKTESPHNKITTEISPRAPPIG